MFAKNVKFLVYLEFKCLLGDSYVGKEFEVKRKGFLKILYIGKEFEVKRKIFKKILYIPRELD